MNANGERKSFLIKISTRKFESHAKKGTKISLTISSSFSMETLNWKSCASFGYDHHLLLAKVD